MKILLGNFNAKVGRQDIFKRTFRNQSLHEISNDNKIRVVNFAMSKNLSGVQCSHIATLINILKTSPDGKAHSQIDHVLID